MLVLVYTNFILLPWLPKWPKTANQCWKFDSGFLCPILCCKKQQKIFDVDFEWPLLKSVTFASVNFLLLSWLPKWPKTTNSCWKFDWGPLCPILCGKRQQIISNVVFEWPLCVVKCDWALFASANLCYFSKLPKTANPCWKFVTMDSSVLYSVIKTAEYFQRSFWMDPLS